jgi:hypothetical protein
MDALGHVSLPTKDHRPSLAGLALARGWCRPVQAEARQTGSFQTSRRDRGRAPRFHVVDRQRRRLRPVVRRDPMLRTPPLSAQFAHQRRTPSVSKRSSVCATRPRFQPLPHHHRPRIGAMAAGSAVIQRGANDASAERGGSRQTPCAVNASTPTGRCSQCHSIVSRAMIDAAQMMGIDQFQDRRRSAAPLRFRWPGARLFQRTRRRPT